jgi:hypothetical protein
MQYVTKRTQWMQKHMFDVTCPDELFVISIPFPPEHENSASKFHVPDAPECTM